MPARAKAGAGIYCPLFHLHSIRFLGPKALGARDGRSVIRHRRRFVTAAQNRVVQIRRVGFSGVKRYNNSLTLCIYPDIAHSRDPHERFSQFADAFIAILAFRRDCDSLQHRFVCAMQVMRVGWIEMMRIEWFDHASIYASGRAAPVITALSS
jgi:hypothetical protein